VSHDALPLRDRSEHRAQRRGHGLAFPGIDTFLERVRTGEPFRSDRSTLGDDVTTPSLPTGRLAHEWARGLEPITLVLLDALS